MEGNEIINELVDDLKPVKAFNGFASKLAVVVGILIPLSMLEMHLFERLRTESLHSSLAASALIVALSAVLAGRSAFSHSVPSVNLKLWRLRILVPTLLLLVAGVYLAQLFSSSAGIKRSVCVFEVLAFGGFNLLLFVNVLRRGCAPKPGVSGALAGLTAGLILFGLMEIFCQREIGHSLAFHLFPVALLCVLGLIAGIKLIPKL